MPQEQLEHIIDRVEALEEQLEHIIARVEALEEYVSAHSADSAATGAELLELAADNIGSETDK